MFELLGMVFGGALRIVPEVLSYLDRRDARAHELAMAEKGLEKTEVEAIAQVASQEKQADYIPTPYGFLNGILAIISVMSATVRPVLTYWYCIILYTMYKVAYYYSFSGELVFWDKMIQLYTPQDGAIMLSIISFWFVDRSLRKNGR